MTNDPIKSLPWLSHGDVFISPAAMKASLAFGGPGGPTSEGVDMLLCLALHNFIETFKDAAFFKAYTRHSIPALARNGADQMDYGSMLHLHAQRVPTGWRIGTPAEYPLPDGYEEQRVVEEAQMILKMADEPQ